MGWGKKLGNKLKIMIIITIIKICDNGEVIPNRSVVVPKVRSENGKKMFMFQGAKVFNMIPSKMQDSQSLLYFKSKCKDIDFDF